MAGYFLLLGVHNDTRHFSTWIVAHSLNCHKEESVVAVAAVEHEVRAWDGCALRLLAVVAGSWDTDLHHIHMEEVVEWAA